jgi:hypothetical protein
MQSQKPRAIARARARQNKGFGKNRSLEESSRYRLIKGGRRNLNLNLTLNLNF